MRIFLSVTFIWYSSCTKELFIENLYFMMERQPAIYIMTNKYHGTLYTGVTSDLIQRVYQHKHSKTDSFTKKYGCKVLVYYECHGDMYNAITREKQIKGGSRKDKIALVESMNPAWQDLYESLL